MQIFVNTNYDFVRWRFRAVLFSLVFILIGFGLFLKNGVNWGIDFAGGANIVLKFNEPVPIETLRSIPVLRDAVIQQYGKAGDRAVLLRLPEQKKETDYAGQIVASLNRTFNPQSASKLDLNFQGRDNLSGLFQAADPDRKGSGTDGKLYYDDIAQKIINHRSELGLFSEMQQVTSTPGVSTGASRVLSEKAFIGKFNVLNQETVGPQVGKELQQKAVWAVILSALAMGAYITLRFDLMFGVGAIVCIIHDVLVALAFLGLINGEFSLNIVAALLLIVGYSINDTVVTYDRMRENRRKIKARMTLSEQMNLAMNQTLSRTILTSGSVVLVLVALILFGGRVIHEFSMILLVGVIAGTYSTVTIVPAVAIAWDHMVGKKSPVTPTRARVEPVRAPSSPDSPVRASKSKRA
jgi:preprotein translocase subunit SecF